MTRQSSDPAWDAGESNLGVTFVAFPGLSDVEIVDPIERHRYTLSAPHELDPVDVDPDEFLFPVDDAIAVTATALSLPSVQVVYVRDAHGRLQAEAEQFADETLPEGRYVVEICAPIKLYLELEGAVTVTSGSDSMEIRFDAPVEVAIGARSSHERPAGTVSTTEAPSDVMAAVSSFGSALKSLSPERSFPTLRGHPPLVELGEELAVPDELRPPDTGVTIVLRPEYAEIYAAASLAYYLGGTLVPGDEPRIETEAGFVHELDSGRGIQPEVERVLEQTFLLDCVTRTEGLYSVDLQERRDVEARVDLDFADLYDRSMADRLAAYLEVPHATIADVVPNWGLAAHMVPGSADIELLPYLVDDLAKVRVHGESDIDRSAGPRDMVEPPVERAAAFTRSARGAASGQTASFVQPPDTGAVEQVWIGDGTPIGASKAIPEAYENRLGRQPATGNIDITVVCNASNMMEEEGIINDIYGSRRDLGFDVDIHHGLTTAELRSVLEAGTDFLHYIGHIDGEGFECADGKLDVDPIDAVGVDAFLLNACESYAQGRALVEAGSIGGIVTLSDVINSEAVRIGQSLARLLNAGFPLYAALDIAKRDNLMGGRYIVVGDGRVSLAQPASVPNFCNVATSGGEIDFEYVTYPTSKIDLGSMTVPYIGTSNRHVLVSRKVSSLNPTREELLEFLSYEVIPVYINGQLRWSSDIKEL